MSNYSKLTNFATKDSLASGNPLKVIKGTEIDDEFEAIETAIGTKADLASPAFTGIPTAPTAASSTDTTQVATTAFVQDVITGSNIAFTDVNQSFTKSQVVTPTTITLSSASTADLSTSNVFIVNVYGNHSLNATNQVAGGCYTFILKNTGAFDVDFSNIFKFSGGDPVITSGSGKSDLVSCVSDGSNLYCSINYDLTSA